jgi:hypothetical protein
MTQPSFQAVSLCRLSTLLLFLLTALVATGAYANIQAAVQWLDGRELPTGVHRDTDLANAADSNAEAWITVSQLSRSSSFPELMTVTRTQRDQTLSSLARLAQVRLDQGQSAAAEMAEVLAAQQPDGGFPSRVGFQSEALTTAWALLALDRNGQGASTAAARAVGYLINSQQPDGGFLAANGNASAVFPSAFVARALVVYRNRFDLQSALNRLSAFLLAARTPSNTIGETFETGLALEALLALRAQRTLLAPVAAALSAQQLANGSFANDAYVTAIAVRALFAFEQPEPNPTLATVVGRVLSADTDLPITGAELVLTGASSATLVSNNEGRLRSNTLPGGAYQATLRFTGMRSVEFAFTLVNARVLDFGDLRMVQGSSPSGNFGLIRGLVRSSQGGAPIAGAAISLATPPTQVISDADGRYQLLQVPAGSVQISASAAGFSSRSVTLSIAPRSILDFSLELTPVTTPSPGARIQGMVVDAQTGQPLNGVSIAVISGAPPVSTATNSAGSYGLATAASPLATVRASLAGYDAVTIQVPLSDNQVLSFSPRLYREGTTPIGANRARIVGTVVNQANRQPIANALIVAVDPSGQQTVRSGSDGGFVVQGLNGPVTQLAFSADAFESAQVLVPLLPLEQRNLGAIGLKPTTVSFYFPDLAIVDSTLATTDPNTFALAQSFTVTVVNRGTAAVVQDFTVLAFIDGNGNGVFDRELEPEVGRVRVDRDIPISGNAEVAIAVSAAMSFRDAPVAFWVDAESEVPEQAEGNNTASSLLGCRVEPALISANTVFEAWRWNGLASDPTINSLAQTPSVTQLTDDNADGVINEYDIPDLVFVAGRGSASPAGPSAIVAISGDGGRELWSRTNPGFSFLSSLATGDIDNDGVAEIIAVRGYREELIAFENDGTIKWRRALNGPGIPAPLFPPLPYVWDQPIIVNLEGDNEAEIIHGRSAYRGSNGDRLWEGEFDAGGNGGKPTNAPLRIANAVAAISADVNLDGVMDVVAGRTLYDAKGRTVWHRSDIVHSNVDNNNVPFFDSGYVAIGNFDSDQFAEIVLSINNELYLLEHTGQTIWGPKQAPDSGDMGAPSVADLDSDGLPEIIISTNERLTVFESDGTVKWTTTISDNSGVTSATVFDFENDGLYEVIHADEQDFRILDALTGTQLYKTRHTSPTVFELPIVADVDGDKQAEIILTGFQLPLTAGNTPGIRVFKARNGAWADAGSVWGSHAFHIDEVNEDSTVPLLETPSWLTHNTYRVQRSPLPDPLGMPDFSVGDLRLIDQGPGRLPTVQVRVGNAGPVDAHEPPSISIWRGDPAAGGVRLKQLRLDTLRPARFQIVNLGEIALTGSGELYAVVDQPNRATECRENNNQRSVAFAATNGIGDLQLRSDKLSYRPGELATFTARVANGGALAAGFTVEWLVRDAQSRTTTTLTNETFPAIPANQASERAQTWSTAGVLGGGYVLAGTLRNARGEPVDTATAAFAIAGDQSGPAGGIALNFSRAVYAPGEQPSLTFRAQNFSSNEVIRSPEVVISISGPNGYQRERSFSFGDLFIGASVDGEMAIENAAAAGTYTATGRLRSRVTGLQYAIDTSSFERTRDITAAISGFVTVGLPTLPVGQTQSCLFTVRNLGSSAQLAVPLRRRVVSLSSGATLSETLFTADLVPGADVVTNQALATTNFSAGDHACVLDIANGATYRLLDSEPFTLTAAATVGIVVTPLSGLITSEAGLSAEFTVRLATAPAANVSIAMTVSDATEFALPVNSLTFTPANWNLARTVIVNGVDDTLIDGDIDGAIVLAPAISTDPNYNNLDGPDPAVTNRDNDAPRISVFPLALQTSESGSSATFSVSINAAPSAEVLISLSSSDLSEWTLDQSALTFTKANWQSPQTIRVTGVDDTDVDGVQQGFALSAPAVSADARFNGLNADDVALTNLDNDGAGIVVSPLTVITAESGLAGSFTVRLNTSPSGEVTIPIGVVDSSEWQILDLDVRLNASNWQVGRTVLVTPVDDSDVDGTQTAVLELQAASSSDPRFNLIDPADVTLSNLDDDGAQILVTPVSGLIVDEGGATDTFSVRLSIAPTAPVTVALSSSDATEFSVAPQQLVFTPANFAAQTVTITGVDDTLVDGNIVGTIALAPATSADPRYNGIDPTNVVVTNIDDERVEVVVSPLGSIETTEAGTTAQITLRLSTAPTADVVIATTSSDLTEWTLDRAQVRITAANWKDPQALVVRGVDDTLLDGDIQGTIELGAIVSADPRYAGLNPTDVPALNRDNEKPAQGSIAVTPAGPLVVTEKGTTATFEVRLSEAATAPVEIALTNPDPTEFALDLSTIRIAPTDGTNARRVTVTGVDDSVIDGDISAVILLAPAVSADLRFNGIDPRDMPVINRDNDVLTPAELLITDLDLVVSEDGDRGRIDIALNRAPVTPVRVAIESANAGELSNRPTLIVFNPESATVAQAITLQGVDEFIDDGDQAVPLRIRVLPDSDPAFAALPPVARTVTNLDNDVAGVALALSGPASILEGESTTLALNLRSQPTASVTVNLQATLRPPGQAGDLSFALQPITVTVEPANWRSPVPLTLSTEDNFRLNGSQRVEVRVSKVVSSDALYASQSAAPVEIEVRDRTVVRTVPIPVDHHTLLLGMLILFTTYLYRRRPLR